MFDENIENYTPLANNLYKKNSHLVIILLITTFFIIFVTSSVILYSKMTKNNVKKTTEMSKALDENDSLSTNENLNKIPIPTTQSISPTTPVKLVTPTKYITSTPSKPPNAATPTTKPLPTSTPVPRTPNPPIMNISYPSEMQSIEFTSSSQKLCVVDVPAGGNTSGLQRKHSINDAGWSSYSDVFTLCFDPKEGLNRFQVQYRNGSGDESTTYTRQFTFHLINDITVSINGQIYMDQNCNKTKDSGEPGVSGVNVTMYKGTDGYSSLTVKTAVSDSNGNYTVSDTIKSNESVNFRASAYSHSVTEYARTSFVTLSSTTTSVSQDIGMTSNNGGCQ